MSPIRRRCKERGDERSRHNSPHADRGGPCRDLRRGSREACPAAPACANCASRPSSAFRAAGLPHRRIEAWHYTDLRALMREALPLAAAPDRAAIERLRGELAAADLARRLVIVDGVFVPELSDAAPAGVTVRSLATRAGRRGAPTSSRCLAAQDFGGDRYDRRAQRRPDAGWRRDRGRARRGDRGADPHRLCERLGRALPRAFRARPSSSAPEPRSVSPSRALRPCAGQTQNCLVVSVGDEAKFTHAAMLTGSAPGSLRIESVIARVGAGAALHSFALIAGGGGLVRRQIFARFEGAGADGVAQRRLAAARARACRYDAERRACRAGLHRPREFPLHSR